MTMDLKQIYKSFPKEANCFAFLEKIIWNDKPVCPYCKTSFYTELKMGNRYHCNKCNNTFSVTVGTVFHKTKCDLRKWFLAIMLKDEQLSAREVANLLSVTKDTAWLMQTKIKVRFEEVNFIYSALKKNFF